MKNFKKKNMSLNNFCGWGGVQIVFKKNIGRAWVPQTQPGTTVSAKISGYVLSLQHKGVPFPQICPWIKNLWINTDNFTSFFQNLHQTIVFALVYFFLIYSQWFYYLEYNSVTSKITKQVTKTEQNYEFEIKWHVSF